MYAVVFKTENDEDEDEILGLFWALSDAKKYMYTESEFLRKKEYILHIDTRFIRDEINFLERRIKALGHKIE